MVKETIRERERGTKQGIVGGWRGGCINIHTHAESQAARHKLDRGSCGDLFDICSMYPIDICVPNLNAFPFRQRGDGTWCRDAIKSCSYAFGIWLKIHFGSCLSMKKRVRPLANRILIVRSLLQL